MFFEPVKSGCSLISLSRQSSGDACKIQTHCRRIFLDKPLPFALDNGSREAPDHPPSNSNGLPGASWGWPPGLSTVEGPFRTVHPAPQLPKAPGHALTDQQKKDLFSLYLGAEGARILGTHPSARAAQVTVEQLMDAASELLQPRKTVLKAAHDFLTRAQQPGEGVEEYVCALRSLQVDCGFADPSLHLMIRVVLGCSDPKAQKELLALPEPTLDKVLDKLRAYEMAEKEQKEFTSEKQPHYSLQAERQRFPRPTQLCNGCGRTRNHERPDCPAYTKDCANCGKKGHFASVCRAAAPTSSTFRGGASRARGSSRGRARSQRGRGRGAPIRQAGEDGNPETLRRLSTLRTQTPIRAEVDMEIAPAKWRKFRMEVDTGAAQSTLAMGHWKRLLPQAPLSPSTLTLRNFDGTPIRLLGTIPTTLAFGGRTCSDIFHIVPDSEPTVLGKNFLTPLKMIIDCGQQQVKTMAATLPPTTPGDPLSGFPRLLSKELGTFPDFQHKIRIQPGTEPFVARLRPIPLARKQAVTQEIANMDEAGIWEPSDSSEWAHPMVTVMKEDGGVRITTDLRGLNHAVIPERFPLPHMKDLFVQLAGSTVFSKLDLKKGYYHILLHPESRDLTTTLTPAGLRRYRRLPMGLTDSASVFQKRIHLTLANCPGTLVYVDDIIVHGKTRGEHDRNLKQVLGCLQAADLRIQPSKCVFGEKEITVFGHRVGIKGIFPDPENLKPIRDCPVPRDVKDVQHFLGMITFYHEFLPDLASLAEPLRQLTRKDTPFEWTEHRDLSFRTLKEMALQQLPLHIFDPSAPTYVTTDASDVGIGATLAQLQNGKLHPIACFSKTLTTAERNYATNEREALAVLMAFEHWEKFLLGRHTTLQTDHQPLQALLAAPSSRRQSAKFERWRERLAHFDFSIEYIPGPCNQAADALSRLHQRAKDLDLKGIRIQDLQAQAEADRDYKDAIQAVQQEWPPEAAKNPSLKPFYKERDHLRVRGPLLYWEERIIPPTEALRDILQVAHLGHPGIVRMKRLLRRTYWWPRMAAQAEELVKFCHPCQCSAKSMPIVPQAEKATIPTPAEPGQQWSMDIAGPFFNGHFLVSAIDDHSGFPEVLDTTNTTSGTLITWLDSIFSRYGNPSAVLSDNGPQFVSEEFRNFLRGLDIHHYTAAVYNPRENGRVEAFNKYLKHGIQAFSSTESWNEGLKKLLKAYRTTPRAKEDASPADKFLKRTVRGDTQPNISPPLRRTLEETNLNLDSCLVSLSRILELTTLDQ